LKKKKDEVLVQLQTTHDNVAAQESEKEELQVKFQEEKSQIQREKEKLLIEWPMVKEVVSKECHFVLGLAQEEKESVEAQVVKARRDHLVASG
jgi:hypothetical protein